MLASYYSSPTKLLEELRGPVKGFSICFSYK
nr:MAG TPA: hypothetical protein [Bacteriophage sp.]